MPAWLVKTEPNEYSYDDLVREGDAEWDGVTNAQAQINLRSMQVGDPIVVYHSGGERAAIGLARVVKGPSPDPTDPAGKRVWVYLRAERRLDRTVSLAALKADPGFVASPLVRQSRLSVVPLNDDQLATIERLASSSD